MKMYRQTVFIILLLLQCITTASFLCANDSTDTLEKVGRLEIENADSLLDIVDDEDEDAAADIDPLDFSILESADLINADTLYKEDYTEDIYDYKERTHKETKESSNKSPNIGTPIDGGFIGVFFKFLLALLAMAAIFFIVMALKDLKLGYRNKRDTKVDHKAVTTDTHLSAPDELNKNSLEYLLKEAVKRGDYTSAIRYHFLIYLEKLQTENQIVYHPDKTNADYLREIMNHKRSEIFSQLSYLYEYVWYGKKDVTEDMYEQMALTFKKALNS